jgi:hypothetical protein
MVSKRFWFGILVMALVAGMTVVEVEAQSNRGGVFTLTNIPSKYNGKYAFLLGDDGDWLGCDSMNPPKPSRIIDGKVILPMWIERPNGRFERYSGNDSDVWIDIYIIEKENDFVLFVNEDYDDIDVIDEIDFSAGRWRNGIEYDDTVTFSNGNATKSYNEKSH